MKAAKPGLVKIADFAGQIIDFRPAKVGTVDSQYGKREDGTADYIEGDLLAEDGTFYPNVRIFQAGLRSQLRDEVGQWVGGLLTTVDTGKGSPMFIIDGSVVGSAIAKKFGAMEDAAPSFNDVEAPF